jgi:hypothetical protein
MKFCDHHWTMLKSKISEFGLDSLVPTSGEEAHAKLVSELQHGASRGTFDPLMAAHNAIVSNALQSTGLELMVVSEENTHRCPICFLQTRHEELCTEPDCKFTYEAWITRAVEDALAQAKELGLVITS